MAIASVICSAESCNYMEEFGKAKEAWLKTFLSLPGGIPSDDRFNRLFSALDSEELSQGFISWTSAVAEVFENEVVAIDGKSMRGTRTAGSKRIVHIVSAWADQNHLVLCQVKVDEKGNEITAIPRLLELLVLKGCIVTIDAMRWQKDLAYKIIEKQANYLLALKGNQVNLQEVVEDSFRFLTVVSSDEQIDAGHGRVEMRRCQAIDDLSLIENRYEWAGLRTLVKIESERSIKSTGKTEKDTRLYISSLDADAVLINRSVRKHWGIENSLHWVLDVDFREDYSRKRTGNAAQNFTLINRIALKLLKNEKTVKVGVRGKD
jgi:predicted transposase YbfD/YdcC